jgi:hypothetical protein
MKYLAYKRMFEYVADKRIDNDRCYSMQDANLNNQIELSQMLRTLLLQVFSPPAFMYNPFET